MKFTDIFIKRPVLAICISLLITILGLQSIQKLQVREYPEMTNTIVNVQVVYAGADASLMQAFVTSKLEEAVAQADNIDYITSSSTPNVATITAKMKLNTDPNVALSDISSKVNAIRSELPSGIDDPAISVSAGNSSLMYIRFKSKELNATQVTDYLQRVVKPQFFTVNGVSKVTIFGATPFGLRIWLDPKKLAAHNLSSATVMRALSANNVQTAAGAINGYYTVYNNKVESTTPTVEELSHLTVVTTPTGNQIKLEDLAKIELDKSSDRARATVDGAEAVVIAVEAAATANSLTVAKNIYPMFERVKQNLPDSIQANILYDGTIAINHSIDEVIKTIGEAVVIVLIVIVLFLGSLRAMIVPIITIPISLIGVLFVLQIMGFSINLLTLLALILAIGLVVDDAIVVLENVERHIKEGKTPFDAAIIGTREIAVPVIAMTITLGAVYSPMALMDGVTGALFKEFALTLAGAVFISGIAALTLSPMMSANILQQKAQPNRFELLIEKSLEKMTACYVGLLSLVMSMRGFVVFFAVLIFTSLPFLFSSLPTEVAPTEDRGFVVAISSGPSNTNLDYTQQALRPFETKVKAIPEIDSMMSIAGFSGAGNSSLAIIMLKDWAERSRSMFEVKNDIAKLGKVVPEMNVNAITFPEISTGESGLPFSLVITSAESYQKLAQVALKVLEKAQASGQFFFAMLDLKFDTATMKMTFDREKMGTYGITMSQVSTTLGSFLSGATITRVDIDSRAYPIISQVPRADRLNPQDLMNYYVTASNGEAVPLGSFIKMELTTAPASLNKMNQLNSATIGGVVSGSIGDAVNWAKAELDQTLPQGYQYDFLSESRQYVQEGNAMLMTFGLAIVIIFIVLAIQFESWRDPMVIMVSVPLAISGALLVMNILGMAKIQGATLNIYSQVGLVTLVGLITKHGILMCEVAKEQQLHHNKSRFNAIIYAATIRLRPILMTTAAMIAGLIPLLFASGAGANARFSIGVVIIAGLGVGTLFTLFILPVIYSFIASEHKPLPEFDEQKYES
ncbi:efflux RND transporter permease subunit [Pasteurella atlantica]|uniref:efflux RND transporter permease subunit n=1 Tax=Pasteurellaceae TaxID=712 RepID=UPI002756674F|nr:efflux RND transporter permease subunit [Pasteurella atlantica]MDP8034524.1 efflux RND transporter permease subunit [Pasteurella atlantica]MDP8036442.1 efflux RND transporter permease subunit [Pasteurella atlantica]MDP8038409.1 efflux RND transporter permease subunit [Pasteurella atlantica]MDP8048761.1 efflux RND transporter permease subunit [Pasteurella atlantica]MDP8050718.1 efflux RND transporter permease subunit [Pasteurella atlantica]